MATEMNTAGSTSAGTVRALAEAKPPADGFDVRRWVSSKVYWRGVGYFRDGRVISFELGDDDSIRAEVQGSELYEVGISWDDDGSPRVGCTCPYDWEPLCKHAVAAILYWQREGEDLDEGAREFGIEEVLPEAGFDRERHIAELAELEVKRRRSPKLLESIKILKRPRGGPCGEYAVSSGTVKGSYSVMVRDARDLSQTTCDCPDYLINELSTCKHIELVNGRVAKSRGRGRADPRIWISVKPRNTYRDAGVSPYEEVHIHSADGRVRERLFADGAIAEELWAADGHLRPLPAGAAASDQFAKALAGIRHALGRKSAPEIVTAPRVHGLLREIDEDRAWKARLAGLIARPRKFSEWAKIRDSLPIKLYEYQEEGVLFAVKNRRSFIGDDMGLGKTVQAIAAAMLIKRLSGIKRVVVFCPASLKFQWKKEIERISGDDAMIVQGGRLARREIYRKSGAMFLIVNYELIFRDEEFLKEMGPDMIILDEAQRIKNWETKTAKGIKRLASEFALVLTGTPLENKLLELHSICEFLRPRAMGPMWRLLPTYGNLDADEKLVGFSNLSDLRCRIAPFFIRRDKQKVLNQLPDKVINEYTTEITAEQRAYHDDYEAALARLISIAKRRPLTPEEMRRVFMCLTNMRIISNSLAQHDWKKTAPVIDVPGPLSLSQIHGFHSPKLLEFRSVMEDLIERPDAKFVIFSQWERMLFLAEASIRDLLMRHGTEAVIFSGALRASARPAVIERFIDDPRLRVFFSTDAGGLGLNLQESASYVINLEMPWNPAVLDQRIARVHRLGQRNTVNVVNFISTGCIEERVYEAVGNKRKLFDGLFDGSTDSIAFEKGSAFLDRLKGLVPVASDASDESPPKPLPCMEATEEPHESAGAQPTEAPATEEKREVDITGLLKAIGSLTGNREIARCGDGSLKIGVEERDGELKLTLKRPPAGFISGMKDLFAGLSRAMDALGE